jgi:hypothetical protein
MSVTIPAKAPIFALKELIGRIKAGQEPVKEMLEASNWLFDGYTPTPHAFCPINTAHEHREQYIVPIAPSADALTYELRFAYWTTAGTWDLTVETSPDGSTWSTATSHTYLSVAAGEHFVNPYSPTFGVPAATTHIRYTLEHADTANDIQLQYAALAPDSPGTIPSRRATSGWVAFDDAQLAAVGAPIHVEYFNRLRDNVLALVGDRVHQVASFVQRTTSSRLTLTKTASISHRTLFVAPYYLRGQGSPRVRCRAWANDSGTAVLRFGQLGGAQTTGIACDNTPRTATLDLVGESGLVYCVVEPDAGTTPLYATIDWTPGD